MTEMAEFTPVSVMSCGCQQDARGLIPCRSHAGKVKRWNEIGNMTAVAELWPETKDTTNSK